MIAHLIFSHPSTCPICDLLVAVLALTAVVTALGGKVEGVANMVFFLPVVIYGYYLGDIYLRPDTAESIYHSVWILLAGLIYLFNYSRSEIKIGIYFLVAMATLLVHLSFAGHLNDSFFYYSPITANPLFLFVVFAAVVYALRFKGRRTIRQLKDELRLNAQGLEQVIQRSSYLICRIAAERDEEGNIERLLVKKVNNAFEAAFKRSLYELQDQEANYIFRLIFSGGFDVNSLIFFNKKKAIEFYSEKWERWYKVQVLNPRYNQYYLIFEDISAVKREIAQLKANERRYKVLLEAIPDIFYVIDRDGIFEDFVIKESDVLKMSDLNIIGKTLFNVGYPRDLANKIYECLLYCLEHGTIETIEYAMNTPNGTFIFEMRLARLNEDSVISIARDITKRKTIEFDLEKALKRAKASDRLKSAFLKNLSHEIKTPMNIITNFSQMLVDPDLEAEERFEVVNQISANGQQLLNMIDNTVHLAKIETDGLELSKTFCKVNQLLRDVYNIYFPLIPDNLDLRLSTEFAVKNPEFGFVTDFELLRSSMIILADNAVKFTRQGQIVIGYEMLHSKAIRFFVKDTGVGIPEDEFENIFSRFYRVPNEINRSTTGSGIGLSIAQHYVELLGGAIRLQSKEGEGSIFWFDLPLEGVKGYMELV